MGSIWIREFTGGLDTRRMEETTPGGVLTNATDCHITRGGEVEKRLAFVPTYTLPAGTVGICHVRSGIVVFGSIAAPTLPAGVTYQRLQHADGTTALASVLSTDLYAGLIYAVAEFADGTRYHFYDGVRVTDWFDGRARASFRVTGGAAGSSMTDLRVNGVSILTGSISWTTSNVATAALVAAAINSLTSVPDYSATAVDDQVNIISAVTGVAPNGRAVDAVLTGTFAITPPSAIVLAGGSDNANTYVPGTFVRTIGSKVYAVSDSNMHFSGITAPTKWTSDTTGAGFIDMSSYDSGSEELTAVANYQTYVAVFAGRTVQIWYVDPDPALNRKAQILKNTGTESARSVTEFGDNDLFYLDESGLRSLRARDASNSASTTDIGVPVDSLITAKLQSLSDAQRAKIIGLINPIDGRFWLIMNDEIFIFSFYANAKVSAWTQYLAATKIAGTEINFSVDDATVYNRRVYVRAANVIYVYGGLTSIPTYDETEAEAWLPLLDAGKPTTPKQWRGIDAAVRGTWLVSANMQPDDPDASEVLATIAKTTFNGPRIPFENECTHVGLRFRSSGAGPAILSATVLHYDGDDSENQ